MDDDLDRIDQLNALADALVRVADDYLVRACLVRWGERWRLIGRAEGISEVVNRLHEQNRTWLEESRKARGL